MKKVCLICVVIATCGLALLVDRKLMNMIGKVVVG
jgi:hypothetical protein